MKTDDLIVMLSTGLEPTDRHAARKRLVPPVLLGLAVALLLLVLFPGTRADLDRLFATPAFWLKLALPLSLWISALAISARLASPGALPHRLWLGIAGPAGVAWLLATLAVASAPPELREALVLGRTWRTCSLNIAMLALPCLALMLWALRGLAPTQLRLSGAMAGLFAGATGALAYCLHCPEMQIPFWATWYLAGMSIPTVAGALLGPLALRW
ncbi:MULTISPECIES: DUF1109 domain-containing protein [unclassified Cupriavidus]|uniref:DUF1109 domain-containing protein n=1 Tax=Cupriavidus sp. H19C3 TaxID=3241603 RepID=UPI003BF8366F